MTEENGARRGGLSRGHGRRISTKADWETLLRELREVVQSNITEAEKLNAKEDLAEMQEALPLIEQLESHRPAEYLASTLEEVTAWRKEMAEREKAGTLGHPELATVATVPPPEAPWVRELGEVLSRVQELKVLPRELALSRMGEVEKVLKEMLAREDWGELEGRREQVEEFLREVQEGMANCPPFVVPPMTTDEEPTE